MSDQCGIYGDCQQNQETALRGTVTGFAFARWSGGDADDDRGGCHDCTSATAPWRRFKVRPSSTSRARNRFSDALAGREMTRSEPNARRPTFTA